MKTQNKNFHKLPYFILFFVLIGFSACEKLANDPYENDPLSSMEEIAVPYNFDFNTTKDVDINIQVLDNYGAPMVFIPIEVYKPGNVDTPTQPGNNKLLFKAMTGLDGYVRSKISVASSVEELMVTTDYLGLVNEQVIPISGNQLSCTMGGPQGHKSANGIKSVNQGYYNTLGTWNGQGVPNYLVSPNDPITQSFLEDVNASLPESVALPVSHPMYFQNSVEYAIHLTEMAQVWVTFVSEGAGWTNALGYYSYSEGNPPSTANAISNKTILFPNTSFAGSGGGLQSGNKVYLGTFPGGTVIEWFLVAQGWNNYADTVGLGAYTHYSQSQFNIESTPALRQHNVLLVDQTRELVLLAFEDVQREASDCDQDFNDAVFYATVNPFTALDPEDLPPLDTPTDTDNDGVTDSFDEYPTDPDRAYNFWAPGEGVFGSLAFEDLWPAQGDYDFNDIVIDYQFQMVLNASNNLVEMYGRYVLRASGATFHNSFGIELPLLPSQVSSVTGGDFSNGFINRATNGTELSQAKAVIIAFEDGFDLLAYPGSGIGINTSPAAPWVEPDTLTQLISFVSGLTMADLGTSPFNPFIIIDQNRGKEVHLIDKPPTSLANPLLFGTADDDSDHANNHYYKTQDQLPWAIHIPESFDYPKEKSEINQAHSKFTQWAESSGFLYPDWYLDNPGYRNSALIY